MNTLFVLDEPSIGLHPRDMGRVIQVMQRLRDAGNSLVVVEHDPQVMQAADRLLDMGPGPGERGGEIVFFDRPAALARFPHSLTAQYLSGEKRADSGTTPRTPATSGPLLRLLGATQHNLKNVDVDIPLGHLVCITGVSGSGKSSLIQDVLHPALLRLKGKPTEAPGSYRELQGHERVADVVFVDQTPIGRTTRSNPASYVGAFDVIRKIFANTQTSEAKAKLHRRHVQLQLRQWPLPRLRRQRLRARGDAVPFGRLPALSGLRRQTPLPPRSAGSHCHGWRCDPQSIADVLELTVFTGAVTFFKPARSGAQACLACSRWSAVGLDYLRLGQPVPTLSGGEAQRLKLAGLLAESPTLGQQRQPQAVPVRRAHHRTALRRRGQAAARLPPAASTPGHSLLVIEHNLDVIRASRLDHRPRPRRR